MDSIETLVMGDSGTSGALRFRNGAGEEFLVTLGVHNYKRWCDVVTDLGAGETGMKIQPEYYMDSSPRNQMLWKQLADIQRKSAKGTSVEVKITDDTTCKPGFTVVEKAVWLHANGGTWSNIGPTETLITGGSGTSGALRFRNGAGEEFLVTLGVHNYKRWYDVVMDLAPGDRGMKIQPEYYSDSARGEMLWKQLAEVRKKEREGNYRDGECYNKEL
ncbi:Cytolysin/lectin [Suillus paluster]|uniref:Cytolysin/lectin n=1 Tax=Suillus paluster TaxID=48578 RepID=UPI001B87BFA4|nr:Cytolysin/lectin [Suillus paluster]KAG1739395.1 Cytolysin/lectin [Suillus paluster]